MPKKYVRPAPALAPALVICFIWCVPSSSYLLDRLGPARAASRRN
jgi:hypothetical protein